MARGDFEFALVQRREGHGRHNTEELFAAMDLDEIREFIEVKEGRL